MQYFSTVEDTKLNETYSYGMNAIKYAENNEMEIEVYSYFISRSLDIMLVALAKMKDTDVTKQAFKSAGVNLAAISAVQQGDAKLLNMFHEITRLAINLKLKVPEDVIRNNEKMQEQVLTISKLYLEFCNADTERMKIYGLAPSIEAQNARKKNLSLIKRGLPEEKGLEVKEENMVQGKNACYIATCVYGSYDCPEVWTLRRFRDQYLYRTVLGRVFIKVYYTVSPVLVKEFGDKEWFKKIWRNFLDKRVAVLKNKGYEDTPYCD